MKEIKSLTLISHLNSAQCYLKSNKYTQAKNDCEDALRIEPTNIKALFRKGEVYIILSIVRFKCKNILFLSGRYSENCIISLILISKFVAYKMWLDIDEFIYHFDICFKFSDLIIINFRCSTDYFKNHNVCKTKFR